MMTLRLVALLVFAMPTLSAADGIEPVHRFVETVSKVSLRLDAFDAFSNQITASFPKTVVQDKSRHALGNWSQHGVYWEAYTEGRDHLPFNCQRISAQGLEKLERADSASTPPDFVQFQTEAPHAYDFNTWQICSGRYTLDKTEADFDAFVAWYKEMQAKFTAAGLDVALSDAHRPSVPGILTGFASTCDQGSCIAKVKMSTIFLEPEGISLTHLEIHAFQ